MEIPPGLRYIAKSSPPFVITFTTVYALCRILQQQAGVTFPTWVAIIISLFARPMLVFARLRYKRYRDRSDAAALGAVLPPHVESSGYALLKANIANFKTGYPADVFNDWRGQYGNIYELRFPFEDMIMTFEPDHVKAILATQFDYFVKGPVAFDQFFSLLGTGVFNSDGDMWKFHRSITRPFFSRERISDFEVFGKHADDALNRAKDRLAEGYPIDFQDLVSRFTLDSATEFLFGHDVCSLSAGLPYPENAPIINSPKFLNHPSNVFVKAFVAGQHQSALRFRYGPTWPLAEFWSDKIKPHRKIMDEFVDPLLEKAIARKQSNGLRKDEEIVEEEESKNLLDHLINKTQDNTIIKDELVNLLVAGRDTTACTLTFALYMMAEHPEITRRLRKEILARVGLVNRPTYDDMREMKYLRAFINEVLRLYPPVPFDSRTSNKPTVLTSKTPGSKPIYIPANTNCMYGVFLMHRRTDLWGPDAEEFDPDRFLDERVHKYLTPNPYIFCPFNAGPRICLGQQFAYHESSFFLIRLLQQFSKFSLAQDAQPQETIPPASWKGCSGSKGTEKVWPGVHLTMFVKGGLWVRMEEAKSVEDVVALN